MNFKEHLLKAERNKNFLYEHLLEKVDTYPDWVSIAAFYSALHFIESFMVAKHNRHFEHHEERHTYVSSLMPEIFPYYFRLYELGFNSRYLSINDMPNSEEAEGAVKIELEQIENYVKERCP